MQIISALWGDLEIGSYLADPAGRPWKVIDQKNGWTKAADRTGIERIFPPMDPSTAVQVFVPTHDEALAAVLQVFPGAQIIREE